MAILNLTSRPYADQLELWRPVVGYEDWYQVSNLGRVKRVKSGPGATAGRLLKSGWECAKYSTVKLNKNGECKGHGVHRLVALAFLGDPPTPDHVVNHINNMKHDNRVENLEWVTQSENAKLGFIAGRDTTGERNSMAKLTWDQVHEIRRLRKQGTRVSLIAKMYDVGYGTIRNIVLNKRWVE